MTFVLHFYPYMKKAYFLLTCLLSTLCIFSQGIKYVSPLGNNTNAGTLLLPWLTIQHAMTVAQPGDSVIILPGTYNEALTLQVEGTASQPIVFQGVSRDSVIVDGTGLNADQLLLVDDKRYVKISGVTFTNNIHNYAAGILIQNTSAHIALSDCKITNISFTANPNDPVNANTNSNPLLIQGDNNTAPVTDIIITGNEITNNRMGYSEALSLDGNISGFEIAYNLVHHNTNIGIDMQGHYGTCPNPALDQCRNGVCHNNTVYACTSAYADAAGIYVDGAKDIVIERNIVYGCQYGIEVGCENINKDATNISIKSNFLYNNLTTGIALGGYDYPANSGSVSSCSISNNTTFNNDLQNNGNGEIAITWAENCSIKNNLFYSSAAGVALFSQLGNGHGNVFNYNCWYTLNSQQNFEGEYGGNTFSDFGAWQTACGQETQSLFANPLVISTSSISPDLHLQNNSPCINSGEYTTSSDRDLDGNLRVAGGIVDMGAYEWGSNNAINDVKDGADLFLFPNPASNTIVVKSTENGLLNIYNLVGELIFTQPVTGYLTTINVSSLLPGLYISTHNNTSQLITIIR